MEIYICSIVLNDLQLLEGRTHVVINGFISAPPTTDSASYSTFVGTGGPLMYWHCIFVRKLCQGLLENNRESVSFLGNREMLDLQHTQLLPRITSQDCRGDLIGVGGVLNPKDNIDPQEVGSPIWLNYFFLEGGGLQRCILVKRERERERERESCGDFIARDWSEIKC